MTAQYNLGVTSVKNCSSCHHECHCDNLVCSEPVGVGMTDKNMPCGCGVCECTYQEPYPI